MMKLFDTADENALIERLYNLEFGPDHLFEKLKDKKDLIVGKIEMKFKLLDETNELIISGRDISSYLTLIENQIELNKI